MLTFIYRAIGILLGMVFHEWAHGFISYKLGDPTPKRDGRLSLNPLHHLDPVGSVLLLLGGFGWAKPVSVNYEYYKDPKKGMALTALAGPLTNLIIVIISIILNKHLFGMSSNFLFVIMSINLSMFTFNLLPIPPLDGSKILAVILPEDVYHKYMRIEQYGFYILIAIIATGALNGILSTIMNFVFQTLYNIL